jgi:hypothetical protein
MHISIWQQFASNHSNGFTIVGTFQEPEVAQKAADELRRILVEIAAWYAHPENANQIEEFYVQLFRPPIPPEVEIGQRYGIEWEHATDWVLNLTEASAAANAVTVFEQHVFLSSRGYDSNIGPHPFDALMKRLGGTVVIEEEGVSHLVVTVICTPSDDQTVVNDTRGYFTEGDISQVDRFLIFRRMRFEDGIENGLPRLLTYLKNCTTIEYSIEEG